MMVRISLFGLSLVLAACAPGGDAASVGEGHDGCSDRDGDGAGVGAACTADDCDDGDPGTTDECGQDCAAHPTRRGCPCSDGLERDCFTGPPEALGVGSCDGGRQYPALDGAGVMGQTLLAVEATLQAGTEGARPTLRALGVERSCTRVFE